MNNRILFFFLYTLLMATTCLAQVTNENRRPTNNPVENGPVIDAREVADPTLKGGKHAIGNRAQPDNTALLKQMSDAVELHTAGYQLALITPIVKIAPTKFSEIGMIKVIDVRADPYKVGFNPVEYALRKKGIRSVALQVKQGFNNWLLDDVLSKYIETDSISSRQLVIVINQCWLSNEANYPYTAAHPQLHRALHYDIGIYSFLGYGYFPQKKLKGEFNTLYSNDEKGTVLFDSLAQLVCKEIGSIDFLSKEKDDRLISITDFNNYYSLQKNKLNKILMPQRGIYNTYEDFLAQRVDSDSTEIIAKYDNAGRSMVYAYQLMQFNNQDPISTTKCWGYSDGKNLYVNIGNGFFVKLVRSGGNYIFYALNNMREDRIKASVSNGIKLGNSSFDIIKDYARVTPLTYQLDAVTGKLY